VKDSGFGREGIRHALRDMTEERLLVLVPPSAGPPVAPQRGTG
jgi:hypothetical protein